MLLNYNSQRSSLSAKLAKAVERGSATFWRLKILCICSPRVMRQRGPELPLLNNTIVKHDVTSPPVLAMAVLAVLVAVVKRGLCRFLRISCDHSHQLPLTLFVGSLFFSCYPLYIPPPFHKSSYIIRILQLQYEGCKGHPLVVKFCNEQNGGHKGYMAESKDSWEL